MHRVTAGLGSLALAAGLATTVAVSAPAAPPAGTVGQPQRAVVDDRPDATEIKRRELREAALQKVLKGDAKIVSRNGSQVVKLGQTGARGAAADDQYVELAREKTDKIFVVLAEFGNQRHPDYPDKDTNPAIAGPATFNGPLHNAIPQPDRTTDTKTIWQPDFNRQHFQDMYFGTGEDSLKTYYEKQSSGRYSVDGTVTDWVRVRYNEARYGRSNGFPCAGSICSNSYELIKDALSAWVDQQHAAGRTDAQIKADLASYDQWDRNDYDHDGNFNEPDGYIDHFQIVHAGGDQADVDPNQGEDAIWSHRSKAYANLAGTAGPDFNRDGGTQIGTTGLWVADYTMQPENGGVSVFAHEYAHDLGLPDEYDTKGTDFQDNAVNWWSLMAQSRSSAAGDQAIGTRAADFGAWDKLQLGWLDYETTVAGQTRTVDLGPSEYNSAKAQGLVVVLPDKQITRQFGAPAAGTKQWWSGEGDDYQATLGRSVALPAGAPAQLTFQARWNIEDCGADPCDYAYVEVDDGTGFKAIPGSITKPAEGNGIDGYQATYVPATFDLSAYAGKTVQLRLHYKTDGAARGTDATKPSGLFADEIKVTSGATTVFSDGAESGANGWTVNGFSAIGASVTTAHDQFYVASNRTYTSYDRYLQTGPYNVGFPDRPNWMEHFPYQDGLLVSYWDSSFSDNDSSVHPGQGEILPIDAHPEALYNIEGQPWRGRIQTYDATFGREKADSFTLHVNGKASYVRGQAAVPTFDDTKEYWDPVQPRIGVKVPHAGVKLTVTKQSGTSMTVKLAPAATPGT